MPSFTVFKGQESGVPKQSTTTKPDQLTGDNVFVRVTASGVCGTGMYLSYDDPPTEVMAANRPLLDLHYVSGCGSSTWTG